MNSLEPGFDQAFFMQFDLEQWDKFSFLVGCDEVGRGPLAGPVVACAVRIDEVAQLNTLNQLGINDSKKLTEKKRNLIIERLGIAWEQVKLNQVIKLHCGVSFYLFECDHSRIDEINILQASLEAMAMASLGVIDQAEGALILIDGNKTFNCPHATKCIVKGDAKSLAIGLASIIAKKFRDEKMRLYDELYPGYSFSHHAGYPTKVHREAIAKIGVSPIHRRTFKGVKEFL